VLILTLRTDNPEAEIGLYKDDQRLSHYTWPAHRQLAETVHLKIKEQLAQSKYDLHDITGIIFYKGPGSFTGLRIGASVANALAASLPANIVGETDDSWQDKGVARLINDENEKQVMPEYGAPVHITLPKR
jgi:tRNA threonylcarbamoyladenosine biosynthesis protein TsaB